jgi:hypothetical protein
MKSLRSGGYLDRRERNGSGLLFKRPVEPRAEALTGGDDSQSLMTFHDSTARLGKPGQASHDVQKGGLSDISGIPRFFPGFDHGLYQGAGLDQRLVNGVLSRLQTACDPDADMSVAHSLVS